MKRFFTEQKLGSDIMLQGKEHHHLSQVLRMRPDDKIILVCGDEFDYHYDIISIKKECSNLKFISRAINTANPKIEFVVFMGMIKLDNMSLVVEKLNELGVSAIFPFTSANSNIPAKAINIEKLEYIAKQSCKQCGRSIALRVNPVLGWIEMLDKLKDFEMVIYADTQEKSRKISEVLNVTSKENKPIKIAVVIGPEGGFTLQEGQTISKLAIPVTLGSRILRAETAAITTSSIILSILDEM